MDFIKLTNEPLSVENISDLVVDKSCGAVSIFVGITRDSFEGKRVIRLEYEAYDSMAIKALKAICNNARDKWPAVYGIAIYHRLGNVPCREPSVVIAISSPHRRDSLDAVAFCIEQLKANVPIWKKEVYDTEEPVWKENPECPKQIPESLKQELIDKNLVQINVSSEELEKRIQNFIERKRDQVNISNIHDFIPSDIPGLEVSETCARVRTQFVKRNDSKGHLKVCKVHNEWGPQTVQKENIPLEQDGPLPGAISERVLAVEAFLNTGPVSPEIYKRLKDMEDKIAYLQSVSPEYAMFWKNKQEKIKQENPIDYAFSADDINKKIELLEKQ